MASIIVRNLPPWFGRCALLACLVATQVQAQEPRICMAGILAGAHGQQRMVVEVAHTPQEREQGLMGRTAMRGQHGMLFVFEDADHWTFWMRNTPLALDIVPLDDDGRVLEVLDGVPLSETLLRPKAPIRRVLEVNRGVMAALGATPPNGAFLLLGAAQCPTPTGVRP